MRTRTGRPAAALTLAVLVAAAVALTAGCSAASSSATQPGLLSASMGGNPVTFLGTRVTGAGTVLTDGTGYTLYWFSKDSASSSACDAMCAPQWPPVTGVPKAAAGTALAGRFGTITRADGVVQATYDGRPLYTFAGDFDPGDVSGGGVTQFGGTWHVVHPAP
jgi:predicted lipoprotein with Yx(FWY)xxD motif